MKIMFYTTTMRKGGGERVIANLANFFSKDHEVLIVSAINVESEYLLENNVKLIKLDSNIKNNTIINRISYKKVKQLKQVIKENQPDIIISFFPEPCFRLLTLKMINKDIKKIPIIISERNDPKKEYGNFLLKMIANILYSKADGVVFQTEEAKQFFNKKIRNKSIIIANPINPKFNIESYKGEKEKRIVSVGRLTPQKNHKILIAAFSLLERMDYHLDIYGDGSLKTELEEYIKNLNMEKNISLKGKKDDIVSEIYKSEIFVLPSNYEGMPNSLMEAMTLGLACIATDCPCGGSRFLIENEKNGILIEVNNEIELKDAMKKIIEDKELGKKLGEKAKLKMEEFSIDKISSKWINFIQNIQKKKGDNNE